MRMAQSTPLSEVIAELIMKHAEKVTDGPMNSEAAKITALLEALEVALARECELLGGEARWVAARLQALPEILRKVHRKDLAKRVEEIREELFHRTAPVY
jgi:hypothetical protein